MKIVADNKIPFLSGVFAPFASEVLLPGRDIAPADVADADALIVRTRTRCDARLLAGSAVKFVATATIGYDHIAGEELDRLGIGWSSAPGCNAASVAQYFVSAVVNSGRPFRGRTVGVIGVGNVGRLVAAAAAALDMKVLLNDPPREEREGSGGFVSLDEICGESDFITVHVPLERGGRHPTFHLIEVERLAAMRDDVVFINAARGEAVDSAALLAALKTGRMGATALDVWENEPDIDREILRLATFATPHVAGYSTDGKANGTGMAVRAVAAALGLSELIDWKVPELPEPEVSLIELDAAADTDEQIRTAVNASYDLRLDTERLRNDPGSFEALRGGYPLRREFFAYRVRGGSAEARRLLGALGFQLI